MAPKLNSKKARLKDGSSTLDRLCSTLVGALETIKTSAGLLIPTEKSEDRLALLRRIRAIASESLDSSLLILRSREVRQGSFSVFPRVIPMKILLPYLHEEINQLSEDEKVRTTLSNSPFPSQSAWKGEEGILILLLRTLLRCQFKSYMGSSLRIHFEESSPKRLKISMECLRPRQERKRLERAYPMTKHEDYESIRALATALGGRLSSQAPGSWQLELPGLRKAS